MQFACDLHEPLAKPILDCSNETNLFMPRKTTVDAPRELQCKFRLRSVFLR